MLRDAPVVGISTNIVKFEQTQGIPTSLMGLLVTMTTVSV